MPAIFFLKFLLRYIKNRKVCQISIYPARKFIICNFHATESLQNTLHSCNVTASRRHDASDEEIHYSGVAVAFRRAMTSKCLMIFVTFVITQGYK